MKTYRILYIEEKETHNWALEQILSYINQDRSEGWTDYNKTDWLEGWNEWVEGESYHLIGEAPDITYGADSSFDHEDKDKEFPEHVVVVADFGDEGTRTVATFDNIENLQAVRDLLEVFKDPFSAL